MLIRVHRVQRKARSRGRPLTTSLALLVALLALIAIPVIASGAGTADQSQTSTANASNTAVANQFWAAQTFTAGVTGSLDHVDLNLSRSTCDPGPLTVQIRTTSGGLPTSTVLATATLPSSSVSSTGPSYVSVPFTQPPPSVSGAQYAIVIGDLTAPSGCSYTWFGNTGNPYAEGQGELSSSNGESPWTADPTNDFNFVTYVVPGEPPLATTAEPTHVQRQWATLRGTVNPRGEATTYRFEFGVTKAYGRRTARRIAGSDRADHSFTENLISLKPNTRYHYRIVATNATGTALGQDRTFRTKP